MVDVAGVRLNAPVLVVQHIYPDFVKGLVDWMARVSPRMGDDGAVGLAAMQRTGALTIAQDHATSAVFGMPRAAQRLGVVDQQLPLPAIAAAILRGAQSRTSVRS